MGRKRPVICATSVTETAHGDESPDEDERPPPVIMAENSGAEESSPKKDSKKNKRTPVKLADPNIAACRSSKRIRKPTQTFDDMYDFFTNFKANNKRRRVKQELTDEEKSRKSHGKNGEASDDEDEETVKRSARKADKGNDSAKENEILPKTEPMDEADVITVESSPPQNRLSSSPHLRFSPDLYNTLDNQADLYASLSSQERFREAVASSSNHNHRQRQVYSTQQIDPQLPRVIMPRGMRVPNSMLLQNQQPQHRHSPLSLQRPMSYQSLGGFHLATPSAAANLPQYQDKRYRSSRDNEAVQCPDCGLILKNQFSYNTHRNYVHGQILRAKIICPEAGCSVMSTNMVALVRHLNSVHKYSLRHEQHYFQTENDYARWYRSLVEDGSCSYVRSSGLKSNERFNGNVSLMFYCNRSGRRNLNNRGGGVKMNAVCPAYFRMTKHQSGHVSVYAQLQHIGHECTPKFKSISSFAPLSNALEEIEGICQAFKTLSKTTIPKDYPMEKNSLVNSCLELLGNIKVEFERAKSLIDGIIPGNNDEEMVAADDPQEEEEDVNKSAAYEDLYALPLPQDSTTEFEDPATEFGDDTIVTDDDIQVLKESIYNTAAARERNSNKQVQSTPPILPKFGSSLSASPPVPLNKTSSPSTPSVNSLPSSPSVASSSSSIPLRRSDEHKLRPFRQSPMVLNRKMPMVLTNGRIQCNLCSVILKSIESYHIHRQTQHGITMIKNPQPSPPGSVEVAPSPPPPPKNSNAGYDSAKPCDVCNQTFASTKKHRVLFCNSCSVLFHEGCKRGHIAVCPSNVPSRDDE